MEGGECARQFKLILLGASGVGKSSILFRYCTDVFSEDMGATVAVSFKEKFIQEGDKQYRLAIWDTAGQEKFRAITKTFYRNVQGVLLVYDISCPESLRSLEDCWIPELEANATGDYVAMIVANKSDLRDVLPADSLVTTAQGEEMAKRHGTLFVEASAKSAYHVESAFRELVLRIIEKLPQGGSGSLKLAERDTGSGSDWCNC
jgi:Ras-related protein Rab-18